MKKIMKLSSMISLLVLILFSSCTKNEITSITLNKTTSYLIVGQNDTLSASVNAIGDIKNISQIWTSSNSTVATVSTNGIVTAIASGTATITVKADGKTSTCDVTVDDKILPTLTQAELWYYGNAYGTDTTSAKGSNNFILYLGGPAINMVDLTGNGDVMFIELNTSLSVKDSIPVGTYDMIPVASLSTATMNPFTLVPAYVDSSTTDKWGCWYFGILTDPLTSGNIVVTQINGHYVINYEFYDDYGVKISGVYQGLISFVDATALSAPAAVKNRMKSKSLSKARLTSKVMSFKRR